jgi:hypothetical protein
MEMSRLWKKDASLRSSTEVESAERKKAVLTCRVLCISATLLAWYCAIKGGVFPTVAFSVLAIGNAWVMEYLDPGDDRRISSVVIMFAVLAAVQPVIVRLG